MIKKRFGKKTFGCKRIKGSKAYRCSPLKPKKSKAKAKGTATQKIKGGKKKYKGHKTSRGLKQDMKRKSQEKHEITYRKSKR